MRLNQKRLAKINYGAQNQTRLSPKRNKNPENKVGFRGDKSNQTRIEPVSFFYPDFNCRLWNYTRSCACALVGCTTDRELHPAPKVFI